MTDLREDLAVQACQTELDTIGARTPSLPRIILLDYLGRTIDLLLVYKAAGHPSTDRDHHTSILLACVDPVKLVFVQARLHTVIHMALLTIAQTYLDLAQDNEQQLDFHFLLKVSTIWVEDMHHMLYPGNL